MICTMADVVVLNLCNLALQALDCRVLSGNNNHNKFILFQRQRRPEYIKCKVTFFYIIMIIRALTRILKTGVQDSHLAKSRSPTGKSGSPTPKKLESHHFVHTVYLFHFSRK